LGGEEPRSCSGLAVWGEFTPDGNLIFGRNWDIDRESMKKYMKHLSVVVFNPDSGYSLANIHPLGNVYLETGMNDQGLFIELNNGSLSDPQYIDDRENTVSVLSTALNQCGTTSEAAKYLAGIPADLSYALQVADAENCVSVERPTFGARVREAEQDGVLAAYNNFIPPYPKEWEGKVIDPLAPELDPRYQNLIKLANSEKFFGKLDINSMKDLMDIEVKNGGAVHRGTVYQVIASPRELTLWIRGLDYAGWQEINLKNLFTKK
ncbi:MAG: C45 family autoproteolytic acyltransferase/hydrolase, partial [Desulfotomaculaceae bacterium]|nr:C45 family autoproteolytic acyltransferase/hydrolase [Desulfotomaculaceae bacterium]